MNVSRILRFALGAVLAPVCICLGDALTDGEIRQVIVRFLAPRCGGGHAGENDLPDPELADIVALNGDTNRLARILAEIAQTNNAWYSEMAMWELEKYGTSEQLPFLYSCATNPAIGDRAVKAVLRIEGVTSNSVEAAQRYFALTNVDDSVDRSRTSICADLITLSKRDCVDALCRSNALATAERFAFGPDNNAYWLDRLLNESDSSYRHSKRRLAMLRGSVTHAAQWDFIFNYVTNAISELVAYPEADLPD